MSKFRLTLPELRRMYELDRMILPGKPMPKELSAELNRLITKQTIVGEPLAHRLMLELVAAREELELAVAPAPDEEAPW